MAQEAATAAAEEAATAAASDYDAERLWHGIWLMVRSGFGQEFGELCSTVAVNITRGASSAGGAGNWSDRTT